MAAEALTLLYNHTTALGYGRLGMKLAEGLQREGVAIYDDLPSPPEVRENAKPYWTAVPPPTGWQTPTICWVSTPSHARGWWANQSVTLFSMWEATHLPPVFREVLDSYERVFVPSEQNLELFSQYHPDVRLVPLGIDPNEWHYTPRPLGDQRFFRFLIGGSGKRKGTDLAYRAFDKVFGPWFSAGGYKGPTDMPIPQLVMKCPKMEPEFNAEWLEKWPGRLTDEDEQALYASCHVYVQPLRGEGFGLQPLQAMAQGMPTILTNAHGHTGFAPLGIPIDATMAEADYFMFGHAGDWWEPDFEQLCEAMWDTFKNYGPYLVRAEAGAEEVAKRWTWANTVTTFRHEMAGLIDRPMLTEETKGEWYTPPMRLFEVIVREPWTAEIGGLTRQFVPDKSYYEPADVKRILFEAGRLHPDCMTGPDHGLMPEQVERAKLAQAHLDFCPTCGQQLNSKPTRADAIYDELVANAGAIG